MFRTHYLNQLTKKNIDEKVILSGWVHHRRDHGGLIFIDLRDRYGLTQVVFDPENDKESHQLAEKIRPEFVIKIGGKVRIRPEGMINTNLKTGEIEVLVSELEILNEAKTPPFEIAEGKEVNEELRLKYRYLDIRKERMKNNLILRHKIIKRIRDFMDEKEFIEVETPILIKGTPEGSREYLVPSRIHPGNFYVLPQSPQQLKQLLMVAGMDKYFQIARCFRDEDQRGDRQPEFTQLDEEMSFVNAEDVMKINEELMMKLVNEFKPDKKILATPFPIITWQEAMEKYGSDKPDLRFDLTITDISDLVKDSEFKVFAGCVKEGGFVKALKIPGVAETWSRSILDNMEILAKDYGAKGLSYMVFNKNGIKSPLTKFFSEEEINNILKHCKAVEGDIVFFVADKFETCCTILGQIRLKAAELLKLIDQNIFAFCWITDFPLFEWSKEENKLVSAHHPFTAPLDSDIDLLDKDPAKVKAKAYDFVLNGCEVGGGSIRIHNSILQSRIFELLEISKDDADRRFGHLLRAFTFGAPPHGGIAWGLDRLIMIFCNEPNIREVIPFPKDQKARDLMTGAPSLIPEAQIKELHIKVLRDPPSLKLRRIN